VWLKTIETKGGKDEKESWSFAFFVRPIAGVKWVPGETRQDRVPVTSAGWGLV
jgi:hypothetical protein